MIYATQMQLTKQGNALVPKHPELADNNSILRQDMHRSYGSLIWLLEPNVAPWTPGVFDRLRAGLKGYTSEDYLLCLGNPVLLSMMSVLAAENSEVLRFLQWGNGSYTPLTVTL